MWDTSISLEFASDLEFDADFVIHQYHKSIHAGEALGVVGVATQLGFAPLIYISFTKVVAGIAPFYVRVTFSKPASRCVCVCVCACFIPFASFL